MNRVPSFVGAPTILISIAYACNCIRINQRYPEKIPPGKILPKKILLNAVEREPVPTRVLDPAPSEASYKPKQRSYGKTKRSK